MQDEKHMSRTEIYPDLEPAYSILAEVSENLNAAHEGKQEIRPILENSVDQYQQAREIFLAERQPWLAAWVDLQKASLHCQLAEGANFMGRSVQAHTAMTLINDVLNNISDLPPNLDLTATIYITMTETLFQIRSLFEKPDQLEAIDEFIQGVSENLGEALALDLLYRAEANDLEFTAGILAALTDIEEDQEIIQEQTALVNQIKWQAAARLALTSAAREFGGEK